LDQRVAPEHFLAQVRRLYGSNEEARDTLHFKDITEQAKSERALIASHKLPQTIIDTAPVRIFWKDRDLR
jgi:hypothetical protein